MGLPQKLKEKIDFKVDFWGIVIKVCKRNVIVCIFEIFKCDNLGWAQYFFIPKKVSDSWYSPLSETTKKVKIDLRPPCPLA